VRGVAVSLPAAIHADLQEWSRSTKRRGDRHPIAHAAEHHAWFERIHPFVDGNGRVGRLLLNFLLLQQGYPPAVILAERRRQDLQALRTADGGNSGPLTEVVARAVSGAMSKFLIPKLAQSGKLRALREGRLWLSSNVWLDEYIEARDPRGGLPGSRRRGDS
jgi:fido (protein-threonine AMPylation protein)